MNWGKSITIVIVSFIAIVLGMVYVASKQTNEMIDKNYYDKEIKYQTLIDAAENLNKVSKDSLITQSQQSVQIKIPQALCHNFKHGKLVFLRNDDQKKDLEQAFTPDAEGLFALEKARFSKGRYKVRIEWMNENTPYYREQNLDIQ